MQAFGEAGIASASPHPYSHPFRGIHSENIGGSGKPSFGIASDLAHAAQFRMSRSSSSSTIPPFAILPALGRAIVALARFLAVFAKPCGR